jgi:hypothetical protein
MEELSHTAIFLCQSHSLPDTLRETYKMYRKINLMKKATGIQSPFCDFWKIVVGRVK